MNNHLVLTLIASRIKRDKCGVYTISYIHAGCPLGQPIPNATIHRGRTATPNTPCAG